MNHIAWFFTTYKDVIAGVASGLTALFAYQAVNSWKEQIKYQDAKESAEEIMHAVTALKQSINSARFIIQEGDPKEYRKRQYQNIANALDEYNSACINFKLRTRIDLRDKYPQIGKAAREVCFAIRFYMEDLMEGNGETNRELWGPDLIEKREDDKWRTVLDNEFKEIEQECLKISVPTMHSFFKNLFKLPRFK